MPKRKRRKASHHYDLTIKMMELLTAILTMLAALITYLDD